MLTRTLGSTDLNVSQICLGSMTWGEQNSPSEAFAQLDFAREHGVNFIDTAEIYPAPVRPQTSGSSERIIGDWLQSRGCRQQIILAGKVAGPAPKKWIGHIRGGPCLSREQIRDALTGSLQRLQTDYLDLYQIHWPARNTNYFDKRSYEYGRDKDATSIEAIVDTLENFIRQGLIRYYGICNETPWGVSRYLQQQTLPTSIQNPYNLLNRDFEIGLAEFSHRDTIPLLAYSPLGNGSLTGKYLNNQQPAGARLTLHGNYFYRYTTAQAHAAISQYQQLANDHGITLAQMALAFVAQQPFVASTIVGATSVEQLQHNVEALQSELSQDLLRGIARIHRQHASPCA